MSSYSFATPPTIPPDGNFRTVNTVITHTIQNSFDFIDMNDGRIINVSDPINPGDAVTKRYVDTQSGGNLTGPITATSGITSITSQSGTGTTFLMNTNPVIIGNLTMAGGKITNVTDPTASSDVATKNYVDTQSSGNLTGPIGSVGSATFVTNQTGTGSIFVMNNSPTLITPNIGVATATSLSSGNIDITGILSSFNNTDSVSTLTGSITSSGGIGVQKNVHVGGNCYATEFFATSDRNLKRNINDLNFEDISRLLKVRGYKYNLKNETVLKYGVIAQDLEELGFGNIVNNKGDFKQVSYQSLIPLMIETIRHLNTKIENQEIKSNLLKFRINGIPKNERIEYAKRIKRRSSNIVK